MSTIQRITGMNSGLDVDALVKSSMTPYQSRIDKETQNEKVLEYQQEQYKKIMSDSSDFYDKYFDILKTGNLFSSSTYQTVSFKSGDDTKVTAKGFAGADVSNYKVTTTQLASKATASFDESALTGTDKTKIYVKVGTKEVSVDIVKADGEIDMAATAKNVNSALNTAGVNVTAQYSEFSDSIILESGTMGEGAAFSAVAANNNSTLSDSSNTYIGKNAKGVITKGTETYNINQASNVLTVDNVQFTLNAESTADSITSTKLDDLTDLKTTDSKVSVSADKKTITSADGKTVTLMANDGTITTTKTVTGGTIKTVTLADGKTKITTTDVSGAETTKIITEVKSDGSITKTITKNGTDTTNTYNPVSLSGSTDVTDLKDKIVNFINDYNTLLESMNTKIYETRDKNYMPLTDAQKAAMTDDQIASWEKKAQTGLLRKDTDLERITEAMKSAMSTVMSGSGAYLESIGIEPVQDYSDKNGMFTIDEEKLTQALEEDAGSVKDLFTREASATNTKDKGGVFTQLAATLKSEFKASDSSLAKKAGLDGTSTQYSNTLTKSIYDQKQLIADLNTSFTDKENALYNKYSALETAMQNLNAQQSSLASMLGTS